MASKRAYADRCGVARALDVIGERWALLIVRELLLGPKRFSDLRAGMPRASANVLSERLRDLEEAELLRRRTLGPPVSARVYELTPRGAELEPVLLALGRWGSVCPVEPSAEMSVDSHALALRTLFDAEAAADVELDVALEIDGDVLAARVADETLTLARATPSAAAAPAEATIVAGRPALRSILWEGRSLNDAIDAGDVAVDGDRSAAERFLRLFPRPSAG